MLTFLAALPSNCQTAFGKLGVTVTDEQGVALPSASVSGSRVPNLIRAGSHFDLAPGEQRFFVSGATDAAGSYSNSSVPPGTYLVCAEVPGQAFLNSCKWGETKSMVVASGQTSADTVRLGKGVFLKVHIEDPKSLLPPDRRPLGPPPVIVGVKFGNGAFLAADLVSVTEGADFSMPIPVNTPLELWLSTREVSLADQQGNTVDLSTRKISFTAIPSSDQSFSFTVSGRIAAP